MNTDALPDAISRLFTLLDQRQVDYVLVGGIALLSYVEGRNTDDIDLIVAVSALAKLPEMAITSQDMYFARGQFQGLQIDFLLTSNPLFEQIRRRHTTAQRFDEREITTATVEGLLLLKLYALPSLYREGNFARVGLYENDVATLLYYYQPDQEAILSELAGHLSASDLAEVRGILAEIIQRIQRFGDNDRA
ncbi:MAG: hypothetical protein V9H69_26850 [Anaerolineae bacterium]